MKGSRHLDLVRTVEPGEFSPDPDVVACRNLWRAVLLTQWQAVFSPSQSMTLQKQSAALDARAQAWFGGSGFQEVCALADVDADQVMAEYRRKLAERTDQPGAVA